MSKPSIMKIYGEVPLIVTVTRNKQKIGRWIKIHPLGMDYEAYMCSECKTGDWSVTVGEYKFCPYCGAKMEAEHE